MRGISGPPNYLVLHPALTVWPTVNHALYLMIFKFMRKPPAPHCTPYLLAEAKQEGCPPPLPQFTLDSSHFQKSYICPCQAIHFLLTGLSLIEQINLFFTLENEALWHPFFPEKTSHSPPNPVDLHLDVVHTVSQRWCSYVY